MILTLESTREIVTWNGIPCRVWQGSSAGGVPVTAFIARIAVPGDRDTSELDAELLETEAPNVVVVAR